MVWKLCPKHKNHGLVTCNMAYAVAAGAFNDGAKAYASILSELGLSVGTFTLKSINDEDTQCVISAPRQAQQSSHEVRLARRKAALMQNEQRNIQEGNAHQAWGYSCAMWTVEKLAKNDTFHLVSPSHMIHFFLQYRLETLHTYSWHAFLGCAIGI